MPITDNALDEILALQFTVARAGEGLCEPARLGWWRTDLVDEAGGGDLLARQLPMTHAWASLEAVRAAAIMIDRQARSQLANPDMVRSLFFWGFTIDEKLDERLRHHKHALKKPPEVLPLRCDPAAPFSVNTLEQTLRFGVAAPHYQVVPVGRQLQGQAPADPIETARRLAAALIPLPDHYPFPHYMVQERS